MEKITGILSQLSSSRALWGFVFVSALSLLLAALYFQHVLGHAPCVKCIYQRTAVILIAIAAVFPLFSKHIIIRLFSLALWGAAAIWGLIVANEHLDVIFPDSFFVPPCPLFPEFPGFMPLHEWLPKIFDAPGFCDNNDWQFLSMGMPEWMRIIFSLYIAGWVFALLAHGAYIAAFIQSRKAAR
uniref:disulfide bond formation protein B n=1 Tax=Ningiella ruwaisensis TaxID=2364274 RepID=UPI0010A08D0F|nr:disulfide bond formation protein B [Ningiella ruwaisensis]